MEIIKNLFRKNKKQETPAPFVPYEKILRGIKEEPEREPIPENLGGRFFLAYMLPYILTAFAWLIPILFVVYILTR